MKNQPYLLGFKSALLLVTLLSLVQGCSSNSVKSAEAAPAVETKQQAKVTQTAFKVVVKDFPAYFIDENQNPELTLKRGVTYTFELKASGHPFWIKTKNSTGKVNAYDAGVTGNGTERGTLTFAVPANAPALLHYNCEVHEMMNGAIHIVD